MKRNEGSREQGTSRLDRRALFLRAGITSIGAGLLAAGGRVVAHRNPVATPDEDMRMQVSELRSQIRGQVVLPGDPEYDAERTGWNRAVEHRPAAIAVAAGPEEVASAVRVAAAAGVPVAVQATGHGPAIPADGAMLISTRRLTGLTIDPVAGIARIEAGVTWGTVMEAAAPHGLAPLVGSASSLGAVGFLTNGGLPVLGRRFGFAADHVRAVELVTVDGQRRRATADEHPDLFWAVRGGKGNVGVVTAVEIGLVHLTRLYGGGLFFPGAATAAVLRGWLEWTATQPEEMSSSLALSRFPDLPAVPASVRGTFLVHIRIAYTGPAAEGERLVQPLRELGPVNDTVGELPHARIDEVNMTPTQPAPVRDRGTLLRDLDDAAVDRITELAGPDVELPPGSIEIRHLGGALARAPAAPNAISHRGAPFGLLFGMLIAPGQEARVDAAQQGVLDGLGPWDTGTTLPNYLGTGSVRPEQVRTAYSEVDYARLTAIKATWDPANLFRINHNIPPAP